MIDRRQFERETTSLKAQFSFHGHLYDCEIEDFSESGFGMNTTETIAQNSAIHVIIDGHEIPCKVVYVDGHNAGVKFEKLSPEQRDFLNNLKK